MYILFVYRSENESIVQLRFLTPAISLQGLQLNFEKSNFVDTGIITSSSATFFKHIFALKRKISNAITVREPQV